MKQTLRKSLTCYAVCENRMYLCLRVNTSGGKQVASSCYVSPNKMVSFSRNTTVVYNHQHPSMAIFFGLF
jgi:hypothetical protein